MNSEIKSLRYSTLILMAVFIILFSVIAPHADALTLELNYPEIPTPTGSIDLNCLEIGLCDLSIALLLVIFYGASVWIAGILAFLALIFAGMSYIISGANPGARARANERFINILWGLSILLLANAILYTVNPQLITGLDDSLFPAVSSGSTEYESVYFTSEGLLIRGGSSGTGGDSGIIGGSGNIEDIYNDCNRDIECEEEYGQNYMCDSERKVCIGKYEECVYRTDGEGDLDICWDLIWGPGASLYDKERPGCGTSYNLNCHTLTEIKNNVRTALNSEFSSAINPSKVTNTFFDTVIPQETGQTWNPATEAKIGKNCTPVGLYQLEDNTRKGGGSGCPEGTHKDEDYQVETNHAADVYFRRGCHYWHYWANNLGISSKNGCDAWEQS